MRAAHQFIPETFGPERLQDYRNDACYASSAAWCYISDNAIPSCRLENLRNVSDHKCMGITCQGGGRVSARPGHPIDWCASFVRPHVCCDARQVIEMPRLFILASMQTLEFLGTSTTDRE